MRNEIFKVARGFYRFCLGCFWLIKLPFEKKLYVSESYFPEFLNKRKSKIRIFIEQAKNTLRFSMPNRFYFLYGLDIKDFHNSEDFIDDMLFMRRRGYMDHCMMEFPPISVLRDKSLFGIVAEAYGINTPHNVGVIQNEKIYVFGEKIFKPLSQLSDVMCGNEGNYFLKKIDGECGDGVFHVKRKDGEIQYNGMPIDLNTFFLKNDRYLIQEAIQEQHPEINIIHPKAINTLRLVTVYNKKTREVDVMSCVLRVGKGENQVDNWAMGGLSIGVDVEKGTLRKYGFYKPGFGTKTTEHPDSHIVFEGYKIPYLQTAIDQAKKFHSHLYGLHSIGWDIAITKDGPCFVEGNDNWEISLMQISNHGLRQEFDSLFY
jgi:hypothetical protein